MDADLLRGIGSALGVAGSLVLAFRVTGILKALGSVADMHDRNIMELSRTSGDLFISTGSTRWIANAQKFWLLWLGFALSVGGGMLQLAAALLF